MKVLMISGSRNPDGQTGKAAAALLEGVGERGGETERVFLPQMEIERCRQCDDHGWGVCRTEGKCVIDDDFASLVDKISAADAVVFATPVYFSDLSESLRAFLDRLRRTCVNKAGKERVVGKPAIGICVAGGGGGGAPACTISLEKTLRPPGFDLLDVIPVRRQNLDFKVGVLKATGTWLVKSLSSRT